MKANELMIGDWVKHINGTPYQVTCIKDGHFACSIPHLWEYNNKFEPIPLTAEILEKNGWKDISDHTLKGCETFKLHYEQKGFDYCITIKLRDYFKLESYDDRFYTLCEMEFGCRYVHQFQHALRLCGIEKTIEI